MLSVVTVIMLLLASACSNQSAGRSAIATVASNVSTAVFETTPTPLATPSPTAIVRQTPLPEATVRLKSIDVFCPTESDEARETFNNAVDLKDKGEFEEAERLYLKTIELDPMYCDAMDNLGQLLRQQNRFDEAIAWYLQSLEIFPENTLALQNLALVYNFRGDVQESVDTYEKLIEIAPDNPEGHFGLGSIYFYLNEPDKAVEYLEVAEDLYMQQNSPYVSDARYYLGLAQFYLGDCTVAKSYLIPLYDQFSEEGGINYILGVCTLTTEPTQVDEARAYILKAQAAGIEISAEILNSIEE